MITEALPKNSRYSTSKAEFNLDGYDLFPEKFPIQSLKSFPPVTFELLELNEFTVLCTDLE
jgi:hypothetical protein